MNNLRRGRQHLLAAGASLISASCQYNAVRSPVPSNLVDSASIPGYELVRFWGDKDTHPFDEAMKRQFTDLKAAATTGKLPGGDKISNVLVISGGGDEGAFAAGYLKGWSDSGTRPPFDTVTGVSTGALAAPFAFLGPTHDDELRRVYTDTGADQLYRARWDFGVFGNALKDTAPLRKTIERYISEAFLDEVAAQYRLGRRLLVSTTNLDAERPMIWDLSAVAASKRPDRRHLFVDLLVATSAVPGVFPPVKVNVQTEDNKMHDELHADGAVAMQMFFLPPNIKLSETEEAVFGKPRQRTLFVLRNGKLMPEYARIADNAVALLQRGVQILVKYQVIYNLRLLENAAKDSNTRFKFMGIPGSFEDPPKDKFDKEYTRRLFDAARSSGAKQEWVYHVPQTPELMPVSVGTDETYSLGP